MGKIFGKRGSFAEDNLELTKQIIEPQFLTNMSYSKFIEEQEKKFDEFMNETIDFMINKEAFGFNLICSYKESLKTIFRQSLTAQLEWIEKEIKDKIIGHNIGELIPTIHDQTLEDIISLLETWKNESNQK